MVKNSKILEEFERQFLREDNRTTAQKFKRYDEMYNYAVSMGILPQKNPLENIADKIKVAKIANGIK